MGMGEMTEPQVNYFECIAGTNIFVEIYSQVICPECGEDVADKENLPMHLKTIHQYSKPYLCDQPCEKYFATKYYLVDHQSRKNCLKNDQIECQYCGAKFGTLIGYKEHLKRGKCEKRYQCLDCDDQPYFSKRFDFKNHKEVVHAKVESGPIENVVLAQLPHVIRYMDIIDLWQFNSTSFNHINQ